jgi:hypothetical protein
MKYFLIHLINYINKVLVKYLDNWINVWIQ